MFLTAYGSKPRVSSPVGSPEYQEVSVRFSPDGNMSLKPGKIRNRQTEINSYKEACDVNNLVRRYENGDQLALLRDNTGAYADLTQMPQNIHEAQKLSRNVENLYNSMGDDIKSKYANVGEFAEAFSSQDKFSEFCDHARSCVVKRAEPYQKKKEEVKSDA